jgi:hypothetical protein
MIFRLSLIIEGAIEKVFTDYIVTEVNLQTTDFVLMNQRMDF